MVLRRRKYRKLSVRHPLVGRSISQYSASARPLSDLLMDIAAGFICLQLSLWAQRIKYTLRCSPSIDALKTRSLRYVQPRIQAFAASSRAHCRSFSFRCSLEQSRRALPLEILCGKARVCSHPCQGPSSKGDQSMLAGSRSSEKGSYNFTKKQDILASNQEYAAYNISVNFLDEDALSCILQY